MEPWELSKPFATRQEAHLTCQLLSWSSLTATPAPPSLTALSPSLLFAAACPPQEASAHVSSCPSSWRGPSPSTSLRVSPWTRWSSTSARATGLTFVTCSHVRQLQDLLFTPPFLYQWLSSLSNSGRLKGRQEEDQRLLSLQPSSSHSYRVHIVLPSW